MKKNYFEFGTGGSTFLALIYSQATVTAVDSDLRWLNYLRGWKIIKDSEKEKQLSLEYVNIGNILAWGVPKDESKKHLFQNYSNAIFSYGKNIDLVFIDGRFRVACVLSSLLNCSPDIHIIIHDFYNRPEYHVVLQFLDEIEGVDTMAVFKRKRIVDISKINDLYNEFKDVCD